MKPDSSLPGLQLPPDAEQLVRQGSALEPRPAWQRAASWRALQSRLTHRRQYQIRMVLGLGLAGAVAAALVWVASLPSATRAGPAASAQVRGWQDVDLGSTGHLTVAPGTRLRLPSPAPGPTDRYRVTLDDGQLCARVNHRDPLRQGAFQIDAKDLQVVDLGTRFCVVAGAGPSWVSVEEGQVQVQGSAPEAVMLSGGESVSADDPRLTKQAAPVVVASIESAPPPEPAHARHKMAGGGLSAENALYEAGLRAREAHNGPKALAIWDDYRRKFPDGVFSAEVDLDRLRELASEGRAALALAAADEFALAHPGHWRGAEAELIRADTLRMQLARPAEALPIYERVSAADRQGSLDERASYGACMSLHLLSREVDARVRDRQYLQRFPAGAHRAEIEHLLGADR